MASAERYDAFSLMENFRTDAAALGEALSLFIDRPDYGFIWLAYVDDHPAACASASLAIDTETGGLLATVRDLFVPPERRRRALPLTRRSPRRLLSRVAAQGLARAASARPRGL